MNHTSMAVLTSLSRRLGRNIRFKLLAEAISRIFGLIFFLVLARTLGDQAYGRYAFPLAFAGLFLYFADCGLNTLLIRQLAQARDQRAHYVRHLIPLKAGLSLFTLILTLLVAGLCGLTRELALIFWATLITLAQSWLDTLSAVYNGLEQIEREVALRLNNRLLTLGATLALLSWSHDIEGLLRGLALAWLVSLLWEWRVLKSVTASPWQSRFAWQMLRDSLPFWLGGLFALLYFRLDIAMLYQLGRPAAEVGWYQAVVKLLDLLILLPNLLMSAIYPVLASARDQTARLVSQCLRICALVVPPIMLGGALLAPEMIPFLLGPTFAPAVQAWQMLLWSLLCIAFNHVCLYALAAVHRNSLLVWSNACGLVLNVVLNLWWIPRSGYLGASLSTVLTEIVVCALNGWGLSRVLPLQLALRGWLKALLCALGMGLGLVLGLRLGLFWGLNLLLAIAVYALLLGWSGALQPAEREWLQHRLARLFQHRQTDPAGN